MTFGKSSGTTVSITSFTKKEKKKEKKGEAKLKGRETTESRECT